MSAGPFYSPKTILLGGSLISLEEPLVMGIINITDDSFYKGSRASLAAEILTRAKAMLADGAAILDLGAMSTRPGAAEVAESVEIERLVMACDLIRTDFPDALISIDTFRTSVLKALEPYKINLVNDISGGQLDESIWDWAGQHKVPYILMHRKGSAADMHRHATYDDIIKEILDYFILRIPKILSRGVHDILIDPGIGFAKTIDQNFTLLKHLHNFKILELPIVLGVSRKSLVWKTLDSTPEKALNGTTALHMFALMQGVHILRVHDVREAKETIALWKKLQT